VLWPSCGCNHGIVRSSHPGPGQCFPATSIYVLGSGEVSLERELFASGGGERDLSCVFAVAEHFLYGTSSWLSSVFHVHVV
jgi:hypothetical protein